MASARAISLASSRPEPSWSMYWNAWYMSLKLPTAKSVDVSGTRVRGGYVLRGGSSPLRRLLLGDLFLDGGLAICQLPFRGGAVQLGHLDRVRHPPAREGTYVTCV